MRTALLCIFYCGKHLNGTQNANYITGYSKGIVNTRNISRGVGVYLHFLIELVAFTPLIRGGSHLVTTNCFITVANNNGNDFPMTAMSYYTIFPYETLKVLDSIGNNMFMRPTVYNYYTLTIATLVHSA